MDREMNMHWKKKKTLEQHEVCRGTASSAVLFKQTTLHICKSGNVRRQNNEEVLGQVQTNRKRTERFESYLIDLKTVQPKDD